MPIRPNYEKIFGSYSLITLYEIVVDNNGKVVSAEIYDSSTMTQGTPQEAKFLEEQIKKVILTMPNWKPGTVDGNNAGMNFYLPLKYKINSGSLFLEPSKYIYVFKHRKKINQYGE